MKANFFRDQIKFMEPVLKPEIPEYINASLSTKYYQLPAVKLEQLSVENYIEIQL